MAENQDYKWKVYIPREMCTGNQGDMYNDLSKLREQGWEQVGYADPEDVFIFRRLMSAEEIKQKKEKQKRIWEMIKR